MNIRPRSLMANIVSGTITFVMLLGLAYFIYEKQDSFSLFSSSGDVQSDQPVMAKPMSSERIDEKQVENEVNRIAEEKRKAEAERKAAEDKRKAEAEAKRKAEEAKKQAEAEAKRKAEEARKKAEAEAAEKKRLDEIALKKKQEEEKKKKDEEIRQQKIAEEKKQQEAKAAADAKAKAEADQKAKEKAAADKKAAEERRKAEEAKKAADAKAKAEADAKAKAAADAKAKAEAAENDRIANAYLSNGSFVGAMQQALYNNWSPAIGSEGLTVVIVFYVDQQGNITKIDDAKSKYSGYQPLDDSVKAAVMKTKRIQMPDNKHAINKLVKEGIAVSFDPRDFSY